MQPWFGKGLLQECFLLQVEAMFEMNNLIIYTVSSATLDSQLSTGEQ